MDLQIIIDAVERMLKKEQKHREFLHNHYWTKFSLISDKDRDYIFECIKTSEEMCAHYGQRLEEYKAYQAQPD